MLHYKGHDCTVCKKIAPTESDLEQIQSYAPEPIDAEKLFVGRMSLANDDYDRSHERFTPEYLQRFAETLPGKHVLTGHDYRKDPVGTFIGAEVRDRNNRKELITRYYMLDSSELAAKVKAGIARSVSIGFEPDKRFCDIDGKDYDGWWTASEDEDVCNHIAGREYNGQLCTLTYGGDLTKVSAVEGSFVWLGCQYGAEAIGANQALSPRAKAAFFESRQEKGIWQIPYAADGIIRASDRQILLAAGYPKEKVMPPDIEKGTPPPTEAKLTSEQERLIALGTEYVKFAQEHVKSRYGACKQERTGERLAKAMETASPEEIAADLKAADELFNEYFPGTGKGVPASDQPKEPVRRFNPLGRRRAF